MRRFPTKTDLKSDTVKSGSAAVLLGALVALIQMFGAFDVIPQSFVAQCQMALPYATVVLGYAAAYYRVNQKTEL